MRNQAFVGSPRKRTPPHCFGAYLQRGPCDCEQTSGQRGSFPPVKALGHGAHHHRARHPQLEARARGGLAVPESGPSICRLASPEGLKARPRGKDPPPSLPFFFFLGGGVPADFPKGCRASKGTSYLSSANSHPKWVPSLNKLRRTCEGRLKPKDQVRCPPLLPRSKGHIKRTHAHRHSCSWVKVDVPTNRVESVSHAPTQIKEFLPSTFTMVYHYSS